MSNEGKACDAVLRTLEARTGQARADVSFPERTRIGPPVEIRLNLGEQAYAIEHTQIEAFAGQIETGTQFGRFITPLTDELSGNMTGPAVYNLYFPLNAHPGVRANQMDDARARLRTWIIEHAQRLHNLHPERPTREANPRGFEDRHREAPPGFPYEVTLVRESHWAQSSQHDGVLLVSRIAPQRVEELRTVRVRDALEHKCPKLQRCKEEGARTVLILEDGDISLSNHVVIGDSLLEAVKDRDDLPDEIHLIETSVTTWGVRLMKSDDTLLPDVGWNNFDSRDLSNLTGG